MTPDPHNTIANSWRLTAAGAAARRPRRGHRRLLAAGYARRVGGGRGGFSLLEVILALGILGGAVAVLGEVSRSAMEHARFARDMTIAELLCETKMAEITSGMTALEAVVDEPMDTTDDPDAVDWLYTIEVEEIDSDTGLSAVRVTVVKDVPTEKHPAQFSLTRWIVDSSGASSETSESVE